MPRAACVQEERYVRDKKEWRNKQHKSGGGGEEGDKKGNRRQQRPRKPKAPVVRP